MTKKESIYEDDYFKECQECGKLQSVKEVKCVECDSKRLLVIDNREKCAICKERESPEEMDDCQRCGMTVCFNCIYDDYPYSITLCVLCGEIWEDLMLTNNFDC